MQLRSFSELGVSSPVGDVGRDELIRGEVLVSNG